MKTKFDLTNKDELLSIITGSAFDMGVMSASAIINPIVPPILVAGKYVAEKIFSKDTLKAQQEAA